MAAYWTDFSWPEQATRPLVEALFPIWSQGRDQTKHPEYVEVIRDEEAPARLDGAHMLITRGRYPPDTGPTRVRVSFLVSFGRTDLTGRIALSPGPAHRVGRLGMKGVSRQAVRVVRLRSNSPSATRTVAHGAAG